MLKWVIFHCYNANYVIRTDDDVKVNPQKIVESIYRVGSQYENFVLGNVAKGWKPW